MHILQTFRGRVVGYGLEMTFGTEQIVLLLDWVRSMSHYT